MLYRSALMTDARGSVGGLTASRNRAGAYFRGRVTPTNVPSVARSRARAELASMPAAWQALTDAQRAAWIALFAANTVPNKLGEPINLSGFSGFTRTNTLRLLTAQSILAAAPVTIPSTNLTPPTALVLDVSAGTLAGTVTATDPWAATTNGRLLISITKGQNPTRLSPNGGYTFWGSVSGDTGSPPTAIALSVPPVALVATRVYFVRFRALDSVGRVSAEQIQRVIAVP